MSPKQDRNTGLKMSQKKATRGVHVLIHQNPTAGPETRTNKTQVDQYFFLKKKEKCLPEWVLKIWAK